MLQEKWTTTLNNTSSALLKHLKGYHRAAIPILEKETDHLKARLRSDMDFAKNLETSRRKHNNGR